MIYLQLLGTARIDVDETTLVPSSVRKFALLLYLSAERRRRVSRATLIELLFPGLPHVKANHSLRELVYQLRQAGAEFVTDPAGLQLSSDGVRSDLLDVLEGTTFATERLAAIEGGILPGYAPSLSEGFTEWLDAFRARTALELNAALVPELRRARPLGNWTTTGPLARACLAIDPVNEDGTLAMAEGMALQGGKAKAVRFLEQYIEQVGGDSSDLKLPAAVLRRRIGERLPQRYEGQPLLPFVGRDQEMATLMERLARARAGESGCVLLLGEAGIGKTRMATEFVARAALFGARYVTATAQPHDTRRPMGAFVDLVPELLALPGALGCSPASMSALSRLTKHHPLGADEHVGSVGQSEEVAASIARAIGDLVDAIAAETTLILWFEDAHWLDEMSLQTAATLVSKRSDRRLLILLTSRERREVLARCAEDTTIVTVNPLDATTSRQLIQSEMAGNASTSSDSNQASWLVETAAGNPFFLACLLNHIERTGERFAIPSTISELLDQRIAALSPEAVTVLETSVMLGKYATAQRLVSAIELPHFRLVALLKELEERRMIVKNNNLIQPSHWLIVDSVQRSSSPIATEIAHRRIAALLESESSREESPALLWDCGEHWLAAGDSIRAIEVIRECAKHAVDIGRPREAAELLQRAAEIASGDLRTQLAKESIRLANIGSERDVVLRGIELLHAAGICDTHDDIEVAELTANAFLGSSTDETIRRLRRCLYDADSTPDHKQQVSLALIVFCAQHQRDAFAREAFGILAPLFERSGSMTQVSSLQFFLIYHTNFGDRDEAIRLARAILARTEWPVEQRANAHRLAAFALWRYGQSREALATLQTAFTLAEECGLSRLQFIAASMSAIFYCEIADSIASHDWMARAERIADRVPALRKNFEYLMIRTDLATATCDVAELRAIYQAGQRLGATWPNERIGRWSDALQLLLDHLSGEPQEPQAAIKQLTRFHRHGNSGDCADFEMAVALRISQASESAETTLSRLREYVKNCRLQLPPPSAMLRQVIYDIDPGSLPTVSC